MKQNETRLELERRHTPTCPHRSKGPGFTKCTCPIRIVGWLNGQRYRRSLNLRDWARAEKRLSAIEANPEQATIAAPTLIACTSLYLADCEARKLQESTIKSYRKTMEHLKQFSESSGLRLMEDITLSVLTDFRARRTVTKPGKDPVPIAGSTSRKELEALRAFFAFAVEHSWIPENYAKKLKPPKECAPPTLPFERTEVDAILAACSKLADDNPGTVERTRARARSLILTLLYSGLSIVDAIRLERRAVDLSTGKLLLRRTKTGQPVYVRLGDVALQALAALPAESQQYFFWNGTSKLATAVGNARKSISRIATIAGVKNAHPHRFRDTFSVELLKSGSDLRTVQQLLGHGSIKTTEKHYAPWVESFQRLLDTATARLDFGVSVESSVAQSGTLSGTKHWKGSKLLKLKTKFGGS